MKIKTKIAILTLLLLIVFSFSGCSIQKAGEVDNNKKSDVKKQEEAKNIDSDNDGLLDSEEDKIGTDRNGADTDVDGLSDFDETRRWKTDPLNSDTDGDLYLDGSEVENGYNPDGPGQIDNDSDGLGNADEKKFGTDPDKFDTDDDGFSDKEEINIKRDPLVAG